LEEDGFKCDHPYFHCFIAEPSSKDSGDAIVPDNGGKLSDTGNIVILFYKNMYFYFEATIKHNPTFCVYRSMWIFKGKSR
jgi:hypothetical protein